MIELRNVSKFAGSGEARSAILNNINLTINKGEFVAIVGASGSGKSTLMNLLGCLDVADEGQYFIHGHDCSEFDRDQLAALRERTFGFIFQRYNLIASLNALDNVALPALYAGQPKAERTLRASALLSDLGLSDKTTHYPNQLSGGQQQRVSIARALMNGGEVILADEPTGALDSHSGQAVMAILQRLHRAGHTIILVTHDSAIAKQAERVITIKDGEIIADSAPAVAQNQAPKSFSLSPARHVFALKEAVGMALQAIVAHKLRSLLTMLGIIIGIASVICVVALGNGSQQKIMSEISALGTNTLDIFNGSGFGDRRANRVKNLTVADAELLARQAEIASTSTNSTLNGSLLYANQSRSVQARGVGAAYFDVRGITLLQGRLFSPDEVTQMASVVVLDALTASTVFGERSPLGQVVMLNKIPLQVIGVAQAPKLGNSAGNLTLWLPYSTLMRKITGERHINSITVKMQSAVSSQVVEQNITRLLSARHGKKDFFIFNSDSIKQTIANTSSTMTLLISSIAVISLIVGGIGVMNIMLVSVTERTREIGIKMAIGARARAILQQFLIEAMMLCFIGGALGVIAALVFAQVFNALSTQFTMLLTPWPVVVALACACVIGLLFGYLPARNAARLNPIKALSQE